MRIGAVILYAGLCLATVAIVDGAEEFAYAGASRLALAAELAAGALLLAAALAAQAWRPRRRFVAPLAAAALAWPLAEWNTPGAGPAFTVGLVLAAAWAPLLAHAALRGPDEARLGRAGTATVAAGWLACVGALGLAPALVFDPVGQGCFGCPANRLLIAADADAWHTLERAGLIAVAGWSAAFVIVAGIRLGRSSPARMRLAAPVLVPAGAAVALLGADALHSLRRGFLANDPVDRWLWAGECAALAATAAGAAWERVRAARTRSTVARLVVELGSSSTTGLQERLADRLGDPSLRLLYASEDGAGWVDGEGRAVALPDDGTPIVTAGRPVAALQHRPGLLADRALLDEVAAGARLALEHERLRVLRAAQLAQLRESRARIVAAADAERARLERDLHDGAQQRVVALALGVGLLRVQSDAPELAAIEDDLRAVIADLRQLAHGLYPSVLAEEGLDAALEVLAEQDSRLVRAEVTEERVEPAVESAAYFLVAEVLQRTTGDVEVGVRREDGAVMIELETTAELRGPLTAIEDRAGAIGGTVAANGRRLHVELPCGS
jgi:signal transduction histidine kinase